MLRYRIYVSDALEMIRRIEKDKGLNLRRLKDWDSTLMRLQVIGESVSKIPKDARKEFGIDWKKFERLRNFISHAYARIPIGLVSKVIKDDLPELKRVLMELGVE